MKIALIGYGKMGKEIEKVAQSRGHEIVARIDPAATGESFDDGGFQSADVAIEFTAPRVAFSNYLKCFEYNKPVVSGTTGWLDKLPEIKKACSNNQQTFFYASNFSIGVNILFELNRRLAQIMNDRDEYDVEITEVHHTQKLDAPSGTAISLAQDIIDNIDRKKDWKLDKTDTDTDLLIKAKREGDIPGIHTVKYESEIDEITIHHSAKSRKGFALGAVLAAEFTINNKGFLTMKDMLKF
ncbi:4-hydroxy-tetrahydrodipicolinate reductase [Thermophagus xiamenensis]|uniref:4-hydroxy-tetrahydrodipicolinate reductase n=1 Tax=Thermophagus xiamenensis TaxID=385682 RepID=A0A1I2EQW2_9BACT|nr:4-hydroxy-tetrahydrodipicolinate reductase [Thermophagus xiamenensis]SFE95504.1 dihydrodipicolinate reductase [Thermophagus xiamenensis]